MVSSRDQAVAFGVDRISSPPGASRWASADERLRLGDMLDNFHCGDQVEWPFELLDRACAIVDGQTLPGRMLLRRFDQLGSGIDAGHCRAEPGQRLAEQAGSTADVQRRLAVQRLADMFVDRQCWSTISRM